jgi:hypothetical protein
MFFTAISMWDTNLLERIFISDSMLQTSIERRETSSSKKTSTNFEAFKMAQHQNSVARSVTNSEAESTI